jgi:hypothetical protein
MMCIPHSVSCVCMAFFSSCVFFSSHQRLVLFLVSEHSRFLSVPEGVVVMRGGASAWCWLVLAGTAGTTRADALVPEFACPAGCNSQGYCHDGVCVCYPGWTGPDCTTPAQCPHQCNMQGALATPQLEHSLRAARTACDHSNAPGTTRTPPNSRVQDTASTRAACATRGSLATTAPCVSARKTAPAAGSAIKASASATQTSRARLVRNTAARMTARRRIV